MNAAMQAKLAVNARDTIGEGPAWDGPGRRVIWLDNAVGTVHEARFDGTDWREGARWQLRRTTGAAIPRVNGGLVVVGGTEIFTLDDCGRSKPFAAIDADPALVKLNDAKCDPRGRLWAGTYAHDFSPGRGALYRIDPDGSVTRMLEGVGLSNGLDWSPDGRTFYYIDSFTSAVDAFDFDVARGTISNRRTALKIEDAGPDGMAVDVEGCLWVAAFGTGEVRRYTPAGELVGRVRISTPAVTSCAFGGVSGDELFITSGAIRLPDALLSLVGFTPEMADRAAAAPEAGGLFSCRPGVKGPPATPFAG